MEGIKKERIRKYGMNLQSDNLSKKARKPRNLKDAKETSSYASKIWDSKICLVLNI